MGLFDGDMEVEIVPEQPSCVAGQRVRALLRLGEPDKKAQGGRVELLYRNTYRYTTHDSRGNRTTHTRTEDVVVDTAPMTADGTLRAGELRVELAVPPRAPGTSPDSVEWALRAVVDRRRAVDAKAEAPLDVLVPAEPLQSWTHAPAESHPELPMQVDVSARTLRPGDRVTGTLTLMPTSDVDARSVRVQLRRLRDDPDGNTREDVFSEVVVSPELELGAGERRSFAFDLAVPPDAAPSFEAQHNTQHWYVEGVVDRPRAFDRVARLEVVVHTA